MRQSALAKSLFAAVLVAALVIPLQMIRALVDERQQRREAAIAEVTGRWGASQTLFGPILTIPYRTTVTTKDGGSRPVIETAQLLPERLSVEGTLTPSVRRRGIFSVVLYGLALTVSGGFPALDAAALGVLPEDVIWKDAVLSVGVSDTRGVKTAIRLAWDGAPIPFRPSAGGNPLFASGLHAPVPMAEGGPHEFSFALPLQGSQTLSIVPLGVETKASLRSAWPHPSFTGAFLPETRTVTASGFTAEWRVSHFGRSYPQQWRVSRLSPPTADREEIAARYHASAFGVTLVQPADHYQQSTRSLKYAVLFIVLTFGAFFLFEVFARLSLHPLQYLLVGLALSLFYLLLLSISEQLGFGPAYAVSASATVLLVTLYCARILARPARAAVIGGLLGSLYAYLYVLLRVEDYALLMGSIALFVILAAVMYLTRGVDWYDVAGLAGPPPARPTVPPVPPRPPAPPVPPQIFSAAGS